MLTVSIFNKLPWSQFIVNYEGKIETSLGATAMSEPTRVYGCWVGVSRSTTVMVTLEGYSLEWCTAFVATTPAHSS